MNGDTPFGIGASGGGSGRSPWWLYAAGVGFLLAIGYLVVSSLTRTTPPTFPVAESEPAEVESRLVRDRRVTLDARDPDRWVRFDFSRGAPVPDSAREWDLAIRRFRMIVNGGEDYPGRGGAVALEGTAFDSLQQVPAEGYRPTEGRLGGDPEHPVLEEWYRYDFSSHLLLARGTPFAVRTADGRYALVEVLSYYCPGPEPGCLTFRYHYQGDGSRWMLPRNSGASGGS